MKLQIYQPSRRHRDWYWWIVARNGRVLARSRAYKTKRSLAEALWKLHAEFADIIERDALNLGLWK